MDRILTADQFDDLCNYLESPSACNLIRNEQGQPVSWICSATYSHTALWLRRQGAPLAPNLNRARELGAHCDCDVMCLRGEW